MGTRPFLKWAGNKYRIITQLQQILPTGRRLIEPFLGSAAVFLNTDYQRNLLADNNADLIQLYQFLQNDSEAFIKYSRQFFDIRFNEAEEFYSLREQFNNSTEAWQRAALFLYLNKHCYNGLCRYNSQGEFNVPFGRYKKPYFPEQEMRYFAKKSKNARFIQADFVQTLKQAQSGDIVYCDPPYAPLSATANFTNYSGAVFDEAAQTELAELAQDLAKKSITVVLSNHDTPLTRKLYHQAQIHTLRVKRSISRNAEARATVKEIIAVFT